MCTGPGFLPGNTARSFAQRMSSPQSIVLLFPSSAAGEAGGADLRGNPPSRTSSLLALHTRAPTPASKVQDAHQRLAIEAAPAALLQRSNAGLNATGGVGPATADCHLTSAGGSWWLANGTGTYLLCAEL